ncbi:hypothetical protein QO010_001148 [Caulobacter ginsengisoli]|uniref:MarR family transcriptional regulator n=1 Tax=Caulobacter ginsengisoli TaxID=400775 RepID=A0ABU0IMY7_9CAUL|nr:hypothetical protein [Caulobacter ginsengisoli]MDQ0463377.1 hypothetical protein [Caulobacter ginsengisoli]
MLEQIEAAEAAKVLEAAVLDRVIANPAFEAAARAAVACWTPPHGDAMLLLRDIGRFIAAQWSFFLASEPEGLTRSRLEELLKTTSVSGMARAQALLIYLRFIGFIKPLPTGDSRIKRFAPTEALTTAFTTRLKSELTWAAALDADIAAVLDRFDEPQVADAFRRHHAQNTIMAFTGFRPQTVSLDVFSHRFGGMTVLGALLQAADRGGVFPPEGLARFSVSHLSRLSGAARPQVRALLRAAEKDGMLAELSEGEVRLTPLLVQHVSYLIACSVQLFAWAARRVLAEMGGPGLAPGAQIPSI